MLSHSYTLIVVWSHNITLKSKEIIIKLYLSREGVTKLQEVEGAVLDGHGSSADDAMQGPLGHVHQGHQPHLHVALCSHRPLQLQQPGQKTYSLGFSNASSQLKGNRTKELKRGSRTKEASLALSIGMEYRLYAQQLYSLGFLSCLLKTEIWKSQKQAHEHQHFVPSMSASVVPQGWNT